MEYIDAGELAMYVIADEDKEFVMSDSELTEALQHRFGTKLDYYSFTEMANVLLGLTPTLEAPLSGKVYHIFGYEDDKAFIGLMKRPYKGT